MAEATIMPTGFWVSPASVLCLLCNSVIAQSLDDVPHCGRCGRGFCQNCAVLREESLRCAGDPADCPLRLPARDPWDVA